ncbi:MAG: DUF2335 domain-containing protein [Nitrospinae bacterium]|nr:DUF2335 domain-containing protein [Nitrospinota bacterium]
MSKRKSHSVSITQHKLTVGPIPPPEQLARYNAIVPGFAERIISRWEE